MRDIGVLLGRTFKLVEVDRDGEHYLKFVPSWGVDEIVFVAEADCCSESWFADIIGVSAVLNEEITGVQILDMPGVDQNEVRNRQECTEAYGFRLTTKKGSATFAFRNSSNGYYSGSLSLYSGKTPDARWEPVATDDWSA